MRNKRTTVDFSQHELIVEETERYKIHWLKKPDTVIYNVKFINIDDTLLVIGDFGRWSFCREFHPSADGYVSDHYWLEKLEINSTQKGKVFSSELTREEIQKGLDGELEEYGYEGEELETMKEYYNSLLGYYVSCQEWEYISYAFAEGKPDFLDAESVPFVKEIDHSLQCVFDAFDEICKRLARKEENES